MFDTTALNASQLNAYLWLLKWNCFCCDGSARALFGLLCVPACERAAGKHLGRTWNGWSEVHLFFLMATGWQCCLLSFHTFVSFLRGYWSDDVTLSSQRVRGGPWRGLSAPHALSNHRPTRLKWSRAVNLNVKVSKQWAWTWRCPLKQEIGPSADLT